MILIIDDLVEGLFDLLEGKEVQCEFGGVDTVIDPKGRYYCVPITDKIGIMSQQRDVKLLEAINEQIKKLHNAPMLLKS